MTSTIAASWRVKLLRRGVWRVRGETDVVVLRKRGVAPKRTPTSLTYRADRVRALLDRLALLKLHGAGEHSIAEPAGPNGRGNSDIERARVTQGRAQGSRAAI
jgi:hypothetical protein